MSRPGSIREINSLAEPERYEIYQALIPDWVHEDWQVPEPATARKQGLIRYLCPEGSRAVEISVRHRAGDRDPILYFNMADTFNNQLLVLLVVVNDPTAPRFDTDIDENGNPTNFGTTGRNIPAEIAAMKAGLAPGQVRRGLRVFKRSIPTFEAFVSSMGHDIFFIEPLAYHNAVVFERYGFNYLRGLSEMKRIHREFQPGGELYQRLTTDNLFRLPDAWKRVRRRSWAIHDGILGHPYTGFQMYKRIDQHAGINTVEDAQW